MRKLNGKFLCYLLAGFVALSGSVALAHHLQIKRIPRALLKQSLRAEDDNELARTIAYLDRYLGFEPDDVEQRIRLARLLADKRLVNTPRGLLNAYLALERALALKPDQHDLRRLLVPIALQLVRLEPAREHLKRLPRDGETASLWGQWYEAKEKPEDAIAQYREAIRLAPNQVKTYAHLARLLRTQFHNDLSARQARARRQQDAAEADKVMDALVAKNPQSWQAYVARWDYRRDYVLERRVRGFFGSMMFAVLVQDAAEDTRKALEKGGAGQPEARLAAAEAAQLAGNLEEARIHLDKALQLHHQDARLYQALSMLELAKEERATTPAEKKKCRALAHSWLRRGVDRLLPPARNSVLWYYSVLLIDGGTPKELDEAGKYIAKIRDARFSPAGVDFLQGRLLFARQQWSEAARLLDRARGGLGARLDLADQIDTLLARCYGELNLPGQQLGVYQRLVKRNPASASDRLGLAAANRALGRLPDALAVLKGLEQLEGAPPNAWGETIQLMVAKARQSRRAEDWEAVERALDELNKGEHAGAVELSIIRAEYLTARGKIEEAKQTLERARTKHPTRVEPWTALATLANRRRDAEEAARLLNEADRLFKKASDMVELRLARARFWVEHRSRSKYTAEGLKKLEKDLDGFPDRERARLLNGLAEAQYRTGAYKEAGRLWKRLAGEKKYRRDLRLRLVLFDLAVQEGRQDEMKRVLAEIRTIEGANGAFATHAEALRLIWQVREKKIAPGRREQTLSAAARLLSRVRVSRPSWSLPLEALVQIDLLRNKPEQARDTYEEARKLGNRNPLLVRQIAEALRKQGKLRKASEVYKTLSNEDLVGGGLGARAASAFLLNRNAGQAIELARAAVRRDSRDYRDHLWLGGLLVRAARNDEERKLGEEYLRRALELEKTEAEPWVALVGFLVAQNRQAEAKQAVEEARAAVKPAQQAHLLARCYGHLNMVKEARAQFEIALKGKLKDATLLVDCADFFLRRQMLKEAEVQLRRLLAGGVKLTEEQMEWGHTRLALLLAYDKKLHRFGEALTHIGLRMQRDGSIVKDTRLVRGDSDEVRRCAARVLATQPQWRCREAALRRFEALGESGALNADDRYIMAHLYEAKNDWARTREQLGRIAGSDGDLQHLMAYARMLLRHNEKDEARKIIARVEKLRKARPAQAAEAALAELQARLYEANREGNKAIALLKARVERKNIDPKEVLLLVASLGRQQRFAEALELLDLIWKCPAEMAGGTSVALLRAVPRSTEAQRQSIEKRLLAAIAKEPKNVNLLIQLGDVMDLQGYYDRAEQRYEQALKLDPTNLMALNNLAWLLAQRTEKRDKALTLINKALATYGPRGELLDTRAVVYIKLKRPAEALADLKEATKEALTATRCFHMALAHQSIRDKKSATRELKRATELGLQPALLHPVEQKAHRQLVAELRRR